LLECLSASLQIDGTDELQIEARRIIHRIAHASGGPAAVLDSREGISMGVTDFNSLEGPERFTETFTLRTR
jgi:hypothetical protein